ISVVPHADRICDSPALALCSKSGRTVPKTSLEKCAITGADVLKHLLVKSDFSERLALPEFTAICKVSGKRALDDELEQSSITGNLVFRDLLKTSNLSGVRAEPEHFGVCAFTTTEL